MVSNKGTIRNRSSYMHACISFMPALGSSNPTTVKEDCWQHSQYLHVAIARLGRGVLSRVEPNLLPGTSCILIQIRIDVDTARPFRYR